MSELDPTVPSPDVQQAAAGFTMVELAVATTLLVVGVLSAVMLGKSSSDLQQRIRDQNNAHRIASDLVEQLRVAGPTNAYAQYTASPTVTVQGVEATITFPASVITSVFPGMSVSTALAHGFLPVQIDVAQGSQHFVFATFVGAQ